MRTYTALAYTKKQIPAGTKGTIEADGDRILLATWDDEIVARLENLITEDGLEKSTKEIFDLIKETARFEAVETGGPCRTWDGRDENATACLEITIG